MSLEIILSLFEEIKESIKLIKERSSAINNPDDFVKDSTGVMKLDSIAMRLQVIGETVKKIDKFNPELLNKYPEIEWKKIKRMRDFISHQYSDLDEVEIYTAAKNDVPELEVVINKIIGEIGTAG